MGSGRRSQGFTINKALVCSGPFDWAYHLPQVIGGECELAPGTESAAGLSAMPALPDSAVGLSKYDVVVMSEVALGSYSPKQRLMLSEFVKSGGGMVTLGGMLGYGKSQVHVSPLLMEMLPVTTKGRWDLRKAPAGGLVVQPATPRLAKLQWTAMPRVYYYHDVDLKAGAQVWVKGTTRVEGKATEVPLVVAWPYGKGWVIACLGTELGGQPGQVGLWEWEDWGRLLTILVNASRGLADNEGTEKPRWQAPVVTTIPPPPAPVPAAPPPETFTSDRFAVAKVWPAKIRFRPDEWASGTVTLINGAAQPAQGKLTVSILSGLDQRQELLSQQVALKAGEVQRVPVVWRVAADEAFGRELRAELTDAGGQVLDARGEYFTVGRNNYRLGQCRLVQPWTFDVGAKTLPYITPQDRWDEWVPGIRRAGAVVLEYFFWTPDDFGNLTPEEDHWFSGQSGYLCSQADVHAVIDAAHQNGIAAVTYGKNIMSVSGRQVSRDGLTLIRQHPEWAQWMVTGQPKWFFDVDRYGWTFDQFRERTQTKGKVEWNGVATNCDEMDCVRYGYEEIVRSAQKYGWDGVRFDDHFTLEPVWDGGVNFDGTVYERGGDFEALSARNNRLARQIMREQDPDFLIGYNYAGTYGQRGIRYPDAFAETAVDGQFIMLEWSGWWPDSLKLWGKVVATLSEENHRVQRLGGVPGLCHMGTKNPKADQVHRWESAINYASQGHYYNVSNEDAVVRNTRFMLRYGGLLYDERTQFVPEGDKLFKVIAPGPCVWKPFIHERPLGNNTKLLSVSVINLDPDGDINTMALPPAPLANATVEFSVPAGWKITKAWLLDPDGQSPCIEVKVPAVEGTVPVKLTNIQCWNLLVFELASA